MNLSPLHKEIILFLAKDGCRPASYDAIEHQARRYSGEDIQSAYNYLACENLAIEVRWGRRTQDEYGMKLTMGGQAQARYIKSEREDR